MNFVAVAHTPLAPAAAPARIAYRDVAPTDITGPPLLFLHGGWGYAMYPFDAQIAALGGGRRIVIPDRSGYGDSPPIPTLPVDFHQRAADETLAVIDALRLERPVVWGHSDGAIIALRLALQRPERVSRIVAEATHFFRRKPASQSFFANVIANPDSTPIMREHARAWLAIGAAAEPSADFYDGRLGELSVPALVVHGARDPRTEPGELDALRRAGPQIAVRVYDGGHSPHSEAACAAAVARDVARFLGD